VAGFDAPVVFSIAMDHNTTALERAFQLAKSGYCNSVDDIRHQLKSEGYSTEQITGKDLTSQLKALINSAQTPK
jgi:hypothetical protein